MNAKKSPTPNPPTSDTYKWFQVISLNLGVAGSLFFLLFVGYIPSPVVSKLDAHVADTNTMTMTLLHEVQELNRTVKVLCALTANHNKFDPATCFYPPRPGATPN